MVLAFIPVRGGSKSIAKKNIKPLCGQPLVYWTIRAAELTTAIDKIVVATDSDEIEATVKNFDFPKTLIYRRSPENARDTSSTESVMLEFLKSGYMKINNHDIFVLIQATTPFTRPIDLASALEIYKNSNFDSMLTCVRVKRFFWNEDGTPKNYDYMNRPRRQDFLGELQENGAFYINSVNNILKFQNRLCGKTGIFEMPAFSAIDIDEEDDWITAENLMKKHILGSKK